MALVEGCKHQFDITVPVDVVEKATDQVVEQFQQKAQIPGFRKGKVPVAMVRKRFSSPIREEVLHSLIPRYLKEEVQKENLHVVGEPEITHVDFALGEPLNFKVEFEVAPTFELQDYLDLSTTYSAPEVTEEEINERLETMRRRRGEYVNEDPRPLADGDFAVVALERLETGETEDADRQEEVVVEIGSSETLPEFSENLRGKSPGDTVDISVSYPEDYGNDKLAGQTVPFRAEIQGLRRLELPEVNDEFAKDLGDFQNLEELRDEIRKSIYREKDATAMRAAKDELIDKLVAAHDFPLPETYIRQQMSHQVERQVRTLASQGIDINSLEIDWSQYRERHRERATHDVRASLLLEKIAEREGIHVTNEELDAEVARIAQRRQVMTAVMRAELEKQNALPSLAANIREGKTSNFLFDKARKVPKLEE